MLSKEELKKVIDEFVSIPAYGYQSNPDRRKELLKMYAGDYVEFDGTSCATQVDADCPWEILFTIMSQFKISVFLKFRASDRLFGHVGSYDETALTNMASSSARGNTTRRQTMLTFAPA